MPSFLCSSPALSPIFPNSTFPNIVSPCLARVILPSVPAFLATVSFLWLCLRSKLFANFGTTRLPISRLIILKGALSLLDLFISLLHLLFIYFVASPGPSSAVLPELHIGALIDLLFSFFAIASYARCVHAGFFTSGSLHFAWFCRLLSLIPDCVLLLSTPFLQLLLPSNLFPLLHVPIALLLIVFLSFSDAPSSPPADYQRLDPSSKAMCPENNASFLSAITYSYASKMVWMGLRGTVTYEDLWELQPERQAEVLRDRFYRTAVNGVPGAAAPITLFTLLWRMFQCTWEWHLSACSLAIVIVIGRYFNATFLRLIVSSVNADYPLWLSMVALCTLFFVDLSGKMFTARRDFHSFMAQTNLRSFLSCAIFDKMLKLSSAARARYSAGEILNLLTTDVLRLRFFWHQLRDFVYCPLMIVVAFIGLWMELGVNTLYGIAILVGVLPLNYVLSKLVNHYEQLQMKYKDARLKLVSDVLSGIKVLKLYAWEESMQRRIHELRSKEVANLQKIFFLDGATTVSFELAPLIATLVSFFGFTIFQRQPMRPDVAFVSLLFFGMLRYSIYQVPQLLAYSIKALVSARRVLRFLNEDEQQRSHMIRDRSDQDQLDDDQNGLVVDMRNCSFTWGSANSANPSLQLRDISLQIEAGKLIGIVGRVGNGKSSLLSAILGEMERVPSNDDSKCTIRAGTVGYVPQQAWIQNKTLRANVLFDALFNEHKYRRVLEACALETDLKLLPGGDMTEIGEKGINLSGGQKARVALARAVYMDADLYILDDTLSAVDAHVGAHIFDRVIGRKGLLAGKTRLFALNTLSFLRDCDQIVVMNDGRIDMIGTLDELKQHREGPFADLMREYMERHIERQASRRESAIDDVQGMMEVPEGRMDELDELLDQVSGSPLSESLLEYRRRLEANPRPPVAQSLGKSVPIATNGTSSIANGQTPNLPSSQPFQQPQQEQQQQCPPDDYLRNQSGSELIGRITEEEELCTGMVSRRVYLDYARAFGIWLSISFLCCLFLGSSTFEGLSSVWLAKWSSSNATTPEESAWNLGIYGAFNAVYVISTGVSSLILAVGAYYASTAFHDSLLRSLFHSPMAFFDRTPMGRILNRLSNDIDRIDESIPWAVSYALSIFAEAINSLISICVVIPLLLLIVLPLMIIFLIITHFYNVASVQFRRLTSKSWSSMCSFVQDAHMGSDSIRVFNVVGRYQSRCCRLADFTNESFAIEIFANRWLQIRLDILSDVAVFLCVMVAILMASQGMITLGALAMVISCGYTFTGFLGEIARVWRESEVQMVCVERVSEYIRNELEPEWRVNGGGGAVRPEGWPLRGHIQFRNFCLRYRKEAELVLRELNFEVKAGERIGIVGRTGAGKSSLTMALFRIVEPASGQILIDGVDITTVGLHDLREALTIIPQDPVLFCGPLRSNLDPFNEYSDNRIWEALEKAHLKETVSALEGVLAHEVSEGGSNLSVGQRQLVCLARALLRHKTRILVLDEATAAVDADTDARIQTSIRTHFRHCTVLTIAHRLHTILDYDRVLVMDAGTVAEFDTPTALLANAHSQFAGMARQAGVLINNRAGDQIRDTDDDQS